MQHNPVKAVDTVQVGYFIIQHNLSLRSHTIKNLTEVLQQRKHLMTTHQKLVTHTTDRLDARNTLGATWISKACTWMSFVEAKTSGAASHSFTRLMCEMPRLNCLEEAMLSGGRFLAPHYLMNSLLTFSLLSIYFSFHKLAVYQLFIYFHYSKSFSVIPPIFFFFFCVYVSILIYRILT